MNGINEHLVTFGDDRWPFLNHKLMIISVRRGRRLFNLTLSLEMWLLGYYNRRLLLAQTNSKWYFPAKKLKTSLLYSIVPGNEGNWEFTEESKWDQPAVLMRSTFVKTSWKECCGILRDCVELKNWTSVRIEDKYSKIF